MRSQTVRTFKELFNPENNTYYRIDNTALIFKITSPEMQKIIRLKPYASDVLCALFTAHPQLLSYTKLTKIIKKHGFICSDETRLHRKISELRVTLSQSHEDLSNIIYNTRGVGYSLSPHLTDPATLQTDNLIQLPNETLRDIITRLTAYQKQSYTLTKRCAITRYNTMFALERAPVLHEIDDLLTQYDKQITRLYTELKLHSAEFIKIRLDLSLAQFKTYLGLTRISEFAITHAQWLEWHKHESEHVLYELTQHIKEAYRLE